VHESITGAHAEEALRHLDFAAAETHFGAIDISIARTARHLTPSSTILDADNPLFPSPHDRMQPPPATSVALCDGSTAWNQTLVDSPPCSVARLPGIAGMRERSVRW
jgi:hypothetical protein